MPLGNYNEEEGRKEHGFLGVDARIQLYCTIIVKTLGAAPFALRLLPRLVEAYQASTPLPNGGGAGE